MGSYTNKIGGFGSKAGTIVLGNPPPYETIPLADSTLLGYWPLYDAAGSATAQQDLASGARDATVNGSPTQFSGACVGEAALTFPASAYLKSTGTALNPSGWMIEAWFKVTTKPTGANKALLAGLIESSTKFNATLCLESTGVVAITAQTSAGVNSRLFWGQDLADGRWHHVIGMQSTGGITRLFVDGVAGQTTNATLSRTDFASANLYIGGTGGTFGFVDFLGTLNQVAIYTGSPVADADALAVAYAHYLAGQQYFPLTSGRVTGYLAEVLRDNKSTLAARTTAVAAEVAIGVAGRLARHTSFAVEVLRTTSYVTDVTKSADTSFSVGGVASALRLRDIPVSASGSLVLSDASHNSRDYSVNASDTILISPVARVPQTLLAFAANSISVSEIAGLEVDIGHAPMDWNLSISHTLGFMQGANEMADFAVSSTDGVIVSESASSTVIHTYNVLATDSINFGDAAVEGFYGRGADGVSLGGTATSTVSRVYNLTASASFRVQEGPALAKINPIRVAASSGVRVSGQTENDDNDTTFVVDAGDAVEFDGASAATLYRRLLGLPLSRVHLTGLAEVDPDRNLSRFPSTSLSLSDHAAVDLDRESARSASSHVTVRDRAAAVLYRRLHGMADSTISVSGQAGEIASFVRPASTSVRLTGREGSGRSIQVAAITALGLHSGGLPKGKFVATASEGVFEVGGQSFSGIGWRDAVSRLSIGAAASASTAIGLSPGTGPGTVLISETSGDYPMSFAETPSGLILIADGIDPMIRWDGLAAVASLAGIRPPASPIALGGMNVGTISGRRVAYCRFIDNFGNRSNLSPVSNEADFGRDALIDSITVSASTAAVTVRSDAHGLATGDAIVVGGVDGMPGINGTRVVTVVDPDTFTLNGVVSSGQYQGGGYWVWGVASVVYQNCPTSTDPKVVRRQILRNLNGDASTLYVDIDTDDLSSAVLISVNDDDILSGAEPVPLFFEDDLPAANRYGVPPSHKSVVASHLGRIFATADVTYREGSCSVVFGSLEIKGVATDWRETFAGRLIYVAGATQAYEIAAVDPVAQSITLTAPYSDATNLYATYAIRSAPGERKLVYYTEPSLPEAWPPWNAIAVPEDSDEIVGMLVKGSFLYIIERRHIYRFTFQTDPATDGFLFLSTARGCINNRCHVQVEDATYMLDDTGIHAFDGGQSSTPVSAPVQNLFQLDGTGGFQVDWAADQTLWHAAHDPVRDTIRWFVHFVGDKGLTHALCYDYRLQRWWIEEYPTPITASTVGTIGYRRSLVGTTGRQVLCLSEGALDGVEAQAGLRGTATGGDETSLVDAAALFPDDLGGVPVVVTDGTLKGQVGIIATNTPTELTLVRPWDGMPDSTTQYQIGGVPWYWRSGWFRHSEDEADNPRDVEVVFQPLGSPATLDLSLYYDHSETPRVWKYSRSQDGTVTEDGSPYVSVNLATARGYIQHRLTGHSERYALGDRYVQVGISGVQSSEVVRIFQVGVNGAKGES